MKRNSHFALLALVLLGLYALRPAHAQTFQIQAKGTIFEVSNREHLLDSSVAVGVPFTYTATFDFSAPDAYRYDSGNVNGQYELFGPSYGATFTVGDYTLQPSNLSSTTLFIEPYPQTSKNYAVQQQTYSETVSSTNPYAPAVDNGFSEILLFYKDPSPVSSKAIPPPLRL